MLSDEAKATYIMRPLRCVDGDAEILILDIPLS